MLIQLSDLIICLQPRINHDENMKNLYTSNRSRNWT